MSREATPPYRVGVVGCGDIAHKGYLPYARDHARFFQITACCDLREEAARKLAQDFHIPRVHRTPSELIADPEIDVVLNLTPPQTHASLNLEALRAGKHAYCEKPFALDREAGRSVLKVARETGLQVGCAPDTVLGPGIQSCRHLLDHGALGKARYAKIQFTCAGHEHWHPNPAFFYQRGGGPLMDMGPYYLATVVHLFGPVKTVMGRALRTDPERIIRSGQLEGTRLKVDCPTHYTGSLMTHGGVLVQATFSFDFTFGSDDSSLPEVYGTEASMRCADPNTFEGEPLLSRAYGTRDFRPETPSHAYAAGRGLGLDDMIDAIRHDRPARCSGEVAYHLLDVMLAFEDSEREQAAVEIASTCERPAALAPSGDFNP